jgi:hypothetical protein
MRIMRTATACLFVALLFPSVGVALAAEPPPAAAWTENSAHLTERYTARARTRSAYQDPIAVRSNQQDVWFDLVGPGPVPNFVKMEVCVRSQTVVCDEDSHGSEWRILYYGAEIAGPVRWRKSAIPQAHGAYGVRMRYYRLSGPGEVFDYELVVVPAAQRAFTNGVGDSMVMWEGTTPAVDSPLLAVEGIDGANASVQAHYYALAGMRSPLLALGRARGADVLILNFNDGGQDMRQNAAVVESAIVYLNATKTGTRRLDVAGISMGGVIVRYALSYMEQRQVAHNVGRFVSVDAPQQGAVLDRSLLDWMHDPPFPESVADFEVPANVTSLAGKQLLVYNPFDTSVPTRHADFYGDLNRLNGGNYPRYTLENIGVSFGSPAAGNPHACPNVCPPWLIIDSGFTPEHHFYIEDESDEGRPGSFLPEDVTNVGGVAYFIFSTTYGLYRQEGRHPTFIPYDSALDRVNGNSRFTGAQIDADQPSHHDRIPPEIVEPLLLRLGYPPPPLTASLAGSSTLAAGEEGAWWSTTTGGVTPYATYLWEYRYPCPAPPPPVCTGPICEFSRPVASTAARGDQCGVWSPMGTAASVARFFTAAGTVELRLTVTDAAGTQRRGTGGVIVSANPFAGGGAPAGGLAVETAAYATTALPEVFALEGATPNPFGEGTAVRFALPEAAEVRLVVFDALGREVARPVDGALGAGWHEAVLDGSALPAGVYVVRMEARGSSGTFATARRITRLR